MNKILTALICIIGFSISATGQIGIGTSSPDASAALDITSSDKGFLMPRMSTAQRTAITAPAAGLMVFDTDAKSYWSYVDNAWVEDKPGVGKFVDGTSDDIAYYDGRVGIGIDNPSGVHRLYVKETRSNDNPNTVVRVDAIYDGSGTSPSTYALGAFAENSSSGAINYAVATQGIVENSNSGGTMNYAVGTWPQVNNSGSIGFSSGLIATTTNDAGNISTVRGQEVSVINESGASMGQPSLASFYFTNEGTITGDGYGLFIGGGGAGTVGGNSYALYLSTPFSNVAGNAFALYSDNINNSYIAGNVGFGNLDPQQKVHISGVMRLEPQGTEPTGGLGDFYVNSDGTLYFHNGTEWKAVQLAP